MDDGWMVMGQGRGWMDDGWMMDGGGEGGRKGRREMGGYECRESKI